MQKKRLLHPDIFVSYLIKYFYIFVMSVVVITCVFFSMKIEYSDKLKYYLAGEGQGLYLYLIFGVFILFLLQVFTGKVFKNFKEKQVIIFNIVFFFIQVFIIYNWYYLLGWDVSSIRTIAMTLADGSYQYGEVAYYLSIFSNNSFLMCMYEYVYQICVLLNINLLVGHFLLIINQVFLYSITSYMLYKIIKQITDNNVLSLTGWLLYHVYIGFSPWLSVPYSDGGGLFFPTAILFTIYIVKTEKPWQFVLKYLFLGFCLYCGYKIKPQTIIVMIAIIILLIFRKKKITINSFVLLFKKIMLMVIGTLLPLGLFTYQINNVPVEINEDIELGMTHFLMMGLNEETNGVYSYDDVMLSVGAENKTERAKLNLEVAKQRLEDMGVSGFFMHWYKKLLTNYNDGTFCWSFDGAAIQTKMSDGKPLSFIANYYDVTNYEGIPYYVFASIGQLIWYGILFLSIFSFVKNKADSELVSAIKLAILGLTLFEMIFEPRSRYLFTYAPFYIMLAIYGMYCIENSFFNKKREEPKICEESSVN